MRALCWRAKEQSACRGDANDAVEREDEMLFRVVFEIASRARTRETIPRAMFGIASRVHFGLVGSVCDLGFLGGVFENAPRARARGVILRTLFEIAPRVRLRIAFSVVRHDSWEGDEIGFRLCELGRGGRCSLLVEFAELGRAVLHDGVCLCIMRSERIALRKELAK